MGAPAIIGLLVAAYFLFGKKKVGAPLGPNGLPVKPGGIGGTPTTGSGYQNGNTGVQPTGGLAQQLGALLGGALGGAGGGVHDSVGRNMGGDDMGQFRNGPLSGTNTLPATGGDDSGPDTLDNTSSLVTGYDSSHGGGERDSTDFGSYGANLDAGESEGDAYFNSI